MSRASTRAKALAWSWSHLTANYDDTVARHYCLTDRQIAFLLAVFSIAYWASRWFDVGDSDDEREQFVANCQVALMVPCDERTTQCNGATVLSATDMSDEIEDHMSTPIRLNGKWYLIKDCGCGSDALLFPLSPENTSTSPQDRDDSYSPGGAQTGFELLGDMNPSTVADCYAAKATDYLLDRAQDFLWAVIDAFEIGIDVAFEDQVEFVDRATLLVNLARPGDDIRSISELGKSAIATKIDSAKSELAPLWDATGVVDRTYLYSWVGQSSDAVTRGILNTWLDLSVIYGYNRALSSFAAECISSGALPDGVTDLGGGYYAAKVAEDFQIVRGMVDVDTGYVTEHNTLAIMYDKNEAGSANFQVTIGGVVKSWNPGGEPPTGTCGRGDLAALTAWETKFGELDYQSNEDWSSAPYTPGSVLYGVAPNSGNPGDYTGMSALWVIWLISS